MSIDPTREQFAHFIKDLPRNEPIEMLNLIRLNKIAKYPPGHELEGKGLTGREAYILYGKTSHEVFSKVGGTQVWSGKPECILTGPLSEHWDLAFIARYPSAEHFVNMIKNDQYKHHVIHRQAAVSDSRLIRMKPQKPGASFSSNL